MLSSSLLSVVLLVDVAATLAAAPAADRIAAYGRVSPADGILEIAVPYYQGAPQIIAEVVVKEGDRVVRGQKLATTQTQALAAADLAIARAHLNTAEEKLRLVTAVAGPEESSSGRSAPGGHPVPARHDSRADDPGVSRAEVESAKEEVKRAEVLLGFTEIHAPADGQVLQILTRAGEGAARRALLAMGNTQAMTIEAEVSVGDAGRVRVGARATVRSDAWAGELTGTVTAVALRVQRSTLTAPAVFANVDRRVVEATIRPDATARLEGHTGAEVTVLIAADPAAK